MASLLPGYEYDIFISYRHNDNRSGWVTEFVHHLNEELAATIKTPVSVYFDSNPHDGLLETHHVNKSLEGKLKCLIFIPILSHTYCDIRSYAWNHEFLIFCKQAKEDSLGLDIRLNNRNYTSRILPVQIHNLDGKDQSLFENETGGVLRSIDFIFKSQGVNRPLTAADSRADNLNRTLYRDQINKTANAIEQIIEALTSTEEVQSHPVIQKAMPSETTPVSGMQWIWRELLRRNVMRAGFTYLAVALLLHQSLISLTPFLKLQDEMVSLATWILLIGFPLALAFAWFFEVSPQGFIRTTSPHSATNPFPPSKKKPLTGKPLTTLLIVALILQYFYFNYAKGPATSAEVIDVGDKIITIAVLPFENRSGNTNDKYIADGITDDVINRLTIISKLKVTNQNDTRKYQGNLLPVSDIAKDLEVSVILKGSIERHIDQMVIRAQLIDINNTVLWGNTYQRTTENIMLVQSEIANEIATQLKIQLNDLEKTRLNQRPTNNATAYDYYLRGRSFYYKYKPTANDSAITQFKMAIALDPNYARAWAGLGDAFAQMHGRFAREFAWTDSSIAASTRAIQIDSNLSEGYQSLAAAYNYQEKYEQAFPLLLKSVELNPTNDKAIGNLGTNYLLRGDLPMALRWEKKCAGMNRTLWIPYQLIGWIYRLLGDLKEAESWLLKSLELDPTQYDTYELLGYTYVTQGRNQDALNLIPDVLKIGENETRVLEAAGLIAHFAGDIKNAKKYFQQSIENNKNYKEDRNSVSPIALGQILLEEGNKVEAEVYLAHAMENNLTEIENGSKSFEPPFYIASIYAIRGNKAQSLIWLQKAIDLNWIDYAKILHGPYFTKYKNDLDFVNMVELVRKKSDAMLSIAKEY